MQPKGIVRAIIALTTISAAIMELIDTSIVNVALNQMAGNLGATIEDIAWVITSYGIANVIIIPMTGFLAQTFGRKNYYLASIAIFTFASFMCGESHSLWELVFWRFIQGIGGGGLLSTSQAILFDAFPIEQRGMASGLFGMGIVLGPTLGPTVGGIIMENYNWPLIFDKNIPFGFLASALTYFFIEDSVHDTKRPYIDWTGIVLLIIGIGSLQYVLERGDSEDWLDSNYIRYLSVSAIIGLVAFIWWELKEKHPVVNLRIMKDPNLAFTTMLTFVSGFVLFTSVFIFPLLTQRVLGWTPYETGITVLAPTMLAVVIMPFVGRALQAGAPPKLFVIVGFIFIGIFCLLMSRLDNNASQADFFIPLVFRSMGVSLSAITLTNQAVMGLSPKDIPQGISLNNMIRQLGGSFGIAIMNTIISQRAAIHRNDLIQNFRQGNLPFDERYNAMLQGVSSKLAVTANASSQVYSLMEFTINQQTYLLTYLDAFRFSMLFIALSFPIIFFLRTSKVDAATAKAVAEAAH